MTCLFYSAPLDVPAERAWKVIEAYSRSAVNIFSTCSNEHADGDYRVLTLMRDGVEIEVRELLLSTDPDNMRHSYTVPGVFGGAEHHHATWQIVTGPDGRAVFMWATDGYPHDVFEAQRGHYDGLFTQLLAALNTKEL